MRALRDAVSVSLTRSQTEPRVELRRRRRTDTSPTASRALRRTPRASARGTGTPAARGRTAPRSSSRRRWTTAATMTCASTSSAFWTTRVGSTSPSRIARTIASISMRVVAEGRNEHAATHGVERVSGAADALESVGHALRRLELEHEIDGADVDPQLERARADERAKSARLERLLENEPSLARQRSVIGQRDLLAGERVDPRRHLLGLRAVVDEDERRARVAHVREARAA